MSHYIQTSFQQSVDYIYSAYDQKFKLDSRYESKTSPFIPKVSRDQQHKPL